MLRRGSEGDHRSSLLAVKTRNTHLKKGVNMPMSMSFTDELLDPVQAKKVASVVDHRHRLVNHAFFCERIRLQGVEPDHQRVAGIPRCTNPIGPGSENF